MDKVLYTPKNTREGLKLWMAYPACEAFALASLGYMWLAKLADEMEGVQSERVYTDSLNKIFNPEAVAFSMSFDFDFMGVLEILEKQKIQFLTIERNEDAPLIFAGGPVVTTNPEPYKKIFDFMILGDGEIVFKNVLEILKQDLSKKEKLERLAEISGVYVPYISTNVKKVTETLNDVIYTPILSENSYFKDTFIIEVARGCMNRCAFCTASYLNLPFRSYLYEKIIEAIELGLNHTNKIALLGAQISAHPDFEKIMDYLKEKIESGQEIELGISSLRTDSVSANLIKTLVMGGQKTSTIAIEAASERLRKFINKNLKEEQILDAVRVSRENGLKGLKIYSMIGIPSETQEDIEEFLILAKKIKNANKGFDVTFSFSTFVPKPQTPFQWAKREDTKTLEKKQKYLEKELAKLGIGSKFSSPKWDYWQTLISRGDENLSEFLIEVYKSGGKNSAYKSAFKQLSKENMKAIEGFDFDEHLPWDFIENYVPKDLLKNEYKRLSKYI